VIPVVIKPWHVRKATLGRQQLAGVLVGGILLWSIVALPGAPRTERSFYRADAGQAWQVRRPNVNLGKGLDGEAGDVVCRAPSVLGRAAARGVCVRLPADWAVLEDERRGALARYFAGVFWASEETGSGWSQSRR
jgi:hypothetical protein